MTPRVEVTVRGYRRSIQIDAIVDLGFDGSFCLPMDVAHWIGAEVAGWGILLLADGSKSKLPTAYCVVELLGEATTVQAFLTNTFDPLVGTDLLDHCHLTVDFDSGEVQLKRK
jgi:clan AA aspartic protease